MSIIKGYLGNTGLKGGPTPPARVAAWCLSQEALPANCELNTVPLRTGCRRRRSTISDTESHALRVLPSRGGLNDGVTGCDCVPRRLRRLTSNGRPVKSSFGLRVLAEDAFQTR